LYWFEKGFDQRQVDGVLFDEVDENRGVESDGTVSEVA
jgi:hypothetical protein